MLSVKKHKPIPPTQISHKEAIDAFNIFLFNDTYERIKQNANVRGEHVNMEDQQKFREKFSELQSDFRRKYQHTHYDIINYLHYLSELSGIDSISKKNASPDEIIKIDNIFEKYASLIMQSEEKPIKFNSLEFFSPFGLGSPEPGTLMYGFKGFLYFVPKNYTDDQARLLILEDVDKEVEKKSGDIDEERKYFENLKTKFDDSTDKNISYERPRVSEKIRIEVWRRDGGKCARCGSREKLEYDHIVPISKGGSNTARNIELLCEKCNRSKSNNIM